MKKTNFQKVPILAYHQITPGIPPENEWWAVSAAQFRREMQYLHDHDFSCIPLSELLQAPAKGRSWKRKLVAITFDDAFKDFYTLATPILKEFGFTAAIFVITDKTAWHSEIGNGKINDYLTWEQIQTLQMNGFTFGSHTCTHRRLSTLTNEEVKHELADSKKYLEEILGQPIDWLAYPYGKSTPEIRRLAMNTGYRAAFGGSFFGEEIFNLNRHFSIGGDTLVDFTLGMNSFFVRFEKLRYYRLFRQFLRKIENLINPLEKSANFNADRQ